MALCVLVGGLVQVPCIERNGFGTIKAHATASLALREGPGQFMPLGACIEAMRRTCEETPHKYMETGPRRAGGEHHRVLRDGLSLSVCPAI